MSELDNIIASFMIPLAASAIGAWLGAHFAFKNEREAKKVNQREVDIASARRIIFILSIQFDRLLNFQNQVVEPYRAFPGRWVVMPGMKMHHNEKLHIDPIDADLIMRLGNAELCMEVTIADAAFQSARENIDRRAEFFSTELQPQLGAAGIEGVSVAQLPDIEKKLGVFVTKTAQAMTETVLECVDGNVENHERLIKVLHKFLKDTYPTEKFIKVENPSSEIAVPKK